MEMNYRKLKVMKKKVKDFLVVRKDILDLH